MASLGIRKCGNYRCLRRGTKDNKIRIAGNGNVFGSRGKAFYDHRKPFNPNKKEESRLVRKASYEEADH